MVNKVEAMAVIGGSRAYDLLRRGVFGSRVKTFRPEKTPFGKSAPIHLFKHDGISFLFISRHGEKGYEIAAPFVNYRANIWALKEKGVERIIAWSGPGAINAKIKPGDLVVADDIIDQTRQRESSFFKGTGMGFIRMSDPFCCEIRKALVASAHSSGMACRDGSVYCCTEGPRLETAAEIRMYGSWGADLVGMTLAPEPFLAREMEICYASLCYVTNYAEGIKKRGFKVGELFEGMQTQTERKKVESAIGAFPAILVKTLRKLSASKRECGCRHAMDRYRKKGLLEKGLLKAVSKKHSR
ncbi:MAG: methylthioadenosine phosphorylase [bacterium]|nr:MAG: methylthioadenosine phosphorylase [bacterium]